MRLRSVELQVADARTGAEFLERVWGLSPAGSRGATQFLAGTGGDPYLVALSSAPAPGILSVSFSGSAAEVAGVQERALRAGAQVEQRAFDEPGAGRGLVVGGPEGQTYRFFAEAAAAAPALRERPIQLTHAVINAADADASERFALEALGFRLSDRTRHMNFVRCNRKHHCIAYARGGFSALHHIAFEMQDADAVMRGIGRLRDAGYACAWGPGRHGPGNNVFGYFVAPFGVVVEYTAEVSEVEDGAAPGRPEDWTWPPGRVDHWGISVRDNARLAEAERAFRWVAR